RGSPRWRPPPPRVLLSDLDRLHPEELLEPGRAHLPADAGAFVPPGRRERVVAAAVDVDRAGPHAPRERQRPLLVGRPDRPGQAVPRAAHALQGLLLDGVADPPTERAEAH